MAKVNRVSDEEAFWFKDWNGNVDYVAHDVKEFKRALKEVSDESLEFHLREDKNDFSAWLDAAMRKKDVADAVWAVKEKCLRGNELRKSLVRCFKPRRKAAHKKESKSKKRKGRRSLKHSLRRALVGKRR